MRDVDEHAKSVHLGHDLPPERREPAMAWRIRCRIGPIRGVAVGERHVANAAGAELFEVVERVLDTVASLGAEKRADLPVAASVADVVCGCGHDEPTVATDHLFDEIDLTVGHLVRRVVVGRHVDRPELTADAPFEQPGDVGVESGEAA